MRVIDASYAQISEATFRQMIDDGVEGFMQCAVAAPPGRLEVPPHAYDNLAHAHAAGLPFTCYAAIRPGTAGSVAIDMAKVALGDLWSECRFVAVDVEIEGITVEQIWDAIARVRELAQRVKIYTSYHVWVDFLNNPAIFADIHLINAYWDLDPDYDFASLPYGGWTMETLAGEQYTGGTDYFGAQVDFSEFNPEEWEPVESMGPPSVEDLWTRLADVEIWMDVVAPKIDSIGLVPDHTHGKTGKPVRR